MLSHYVRRLGASTAVALMLGLGFGESAWAQPLSVNLQDQPAITSTMAMRSVMLGVARAGDRLVAVGERGFIIISDDNGGSWRQVSSPVSVTLVRVRFVDPHNGWAVGHAGVVLHSTDGGLTWSRQLDGVEGARIELAAAKEASAKSEDSEAAEERVAQAQQLVDDGADKPLLDLLFFNDKEGMVVGAYGLAFSTHDAGQTWQSLRGEISNPSGLHLYGLSQVGGAIYIVGEQGILLRSEDGARTFQSLTSPYEGTSFGLASTTGGSLILFGLRGNAFESSDHGTTWRRLDTLQPTTLTTSLELRDGSVLLADESGRVVRFNGTDAKAEVMPLPVSGYFSGLMTAANGDLVISSARGMLTSTTPSEITKAVK